MSNYTKNLLPIERVHSFSFSLEEKFDMMENVAWMRIYWPWTLAPVALYILVIRLGITYMEARPKYQLRGPLLVWNVSLTSVYVLGLARLASEIPPYLAHHDGLHGWICQHCPYGCTKVGQFWIWLFVVMKIPELGDTVFVILRKKKMLFLHWFHHSTVLVFTWYLYSNMSTMGVMFCLVNAVIHALMYFYYALKTLAIPLPRLVSMGLTLLQLSQMVIGCYTTYYAYRALRRGEQCTVSYNEIAAASFIYSALLFLFSWFFYKAYIFKDPVGDAQLLFTKENGNHGAEYLSLRNKKKF